MDQNKNGMNQNSKQAQGFKSSSSSSSQKNKKQASSQEKRGACPADQRPGQGQSQSQQPGRGFQSPSQDSWKR